jgi:ABC-type antimicrobial peptide transport system permease subunit
LYVPLQQRFEPQVSILVRSSSGRSLVPELRRLVTSMDSNLSILSGQTLESQQNGPVEGQLRISAAISASVGAVGLLLAAIGVYGVTAYVVAKRTREIGIRLSLGASRWAVIGLVLRQGLRLLAIGVLVGLILGAASGRVLSASRMNTPPPDVSLLTGAAVLFLAIGLAACYLPVRRVARLRATEALRYE